MSFIKKIWKNRITEYPNRRILTKQDNSSEIVTVGRSEGVISQEGDAFSAENMNDLEDRIADGFANISNDAVVLANSNPESDAIKFGINTNGQYGYIKAGADTVTPFRNPTGDALQSQVLAGKTFSSANLENAIGTMPNNGSVTLTPTGNGTVSGQPGYYSEIIADGSQAYQAGKYAYGVTSETLTGRRGSDETWTEFSFTVRSGRTLWVDLFPTVTDETYWVYGGDPPQGYPENSTGHAWSLSGTTLKCSCYRRRSMKCRVYYIN